MKDKSKSFEDIDTIRTIMENSTRFLSLSGLSGVFAGLTAIAGAAVAYFLIFRGNFSVEYFSSLTIDELRIIKLWSVIDALAVLFAAIIFAFILSTRKAGKKGLRIWTPISKRFIVSMIIPLLSGGILILIIFVQKQFNLIIPFMLIFYGLALVNAGKFTYNEVFYLGLLQIISGLAAALLPEYALIFWTFGFGFFHIAYGLLLYRKYEK
jgi:hypothetical protein